MGGPRTLAADSAAWMERRMPQSISAVHIDTSLILAGGWDGAIVAWNLEERNFGQQMLVIESHLSKSILMISISAVLRDVKQ